MDKQQVVSLLRRNLLLDGSHWDKWKVLRKPEFTKEAGQAVRGPQFHLGFYFLGPDFKRSGCL